MDFIIGLPISDELNLKYVIVDRLSKEYHYFLCVATDKAISTKATTYILMPYMFHCHRLLKSIVRDRGTQFPSSTWNAFCQRLRIDVEISTSFYLETNSQKE